MARPSAPAPLTLTTTALPEFGPVSEPGAAHPAADALRRLLRNRLAVAGLLIIGGLTACALLAPVLSVQRPGPGGVWPTDLRPPSCLPDCDGGVRQPPSIRHPFGTDTVGRDQLSRILFGARVSLSIGMISVSLAIFIGTVVGAVAGFFGGWVDTFLMRLIDVMLAFPSILLALAIVTLIGGGLLNVMLAVGLISIPTYARLTRASVIGEARRDYVEASRALGAGRRRLLLRHVMPNCMSPLIVAATLGIGTAILDAAGLGFLGLGAQPPLAEWGLMLSQYRESLFSEWWLVAIPGFAIMLTVLGFNLLGDGLRDTLDPRLRGLGR